MRKWTADFETTTDPNDCRVWAYAVCSIDDPDLFNYGNDLSDFFNWCAQPQLNFEIYFHYNYYSIFYLQLV